MPVFFVPASAGEFIGEALVLSTSPFVLFLLVGKKNVPFFIEKKKKMEKSGDCKNKTKKNCGNTTTEANYTLLPTIFFKKKKIMIVKTA